LNLERQPLESQPGESALPPDVPKGLLAGGDSTPHPRLRLHKGFPSHYLADKHDIIVYVPPGYDRHPERTYPVLYMQDGQNLFDGLTSFIPGRTWQMREHADAAIEAGEVEPLVIVGIYNAGDRRIDEYTHERNWQMGGGNAEHYGRALTEEILPWIATHYRVKTEREHTGLGGSSLGGLVSLYLGLRYASWFGRLALLGDKEGKRTVHDAEMLNRRLKANHWTPGETLHFEKVHGGAHDETSWSQRVRPMLKFLFPAG
jgi:enterochelin esterase-like enzyme